MLKLLRHKGFAKKVTWFIAIIIIISFGILGTATYFGDSLSGYAGKMFGKKVRIEEFDKSYRDVRLQGLLQFGNQFRTLYDEQMIVAESWDRLMLLREAGKQKIEISDREVVKNIQSYPFFQRDGVFDNALYTAILQNNLRLSPRNFEEFIRRNLIIQKLVESVTAGVEPSFDEIYQEFKKNNEKVQVSYVFFSPDDFQDEVIYDEAKGREYFTNNPDKFLMPPSMNVDYVTLAFNKEATDIEADKEATSKQAEEIYFDLLSTPNLAEVAAKYNLPVETTKYFSRAEPNLAPSEWNFRQIRGFLNMNQGEIREPFETENGLVIAQIKDKKDAHTPTYEEVVERVKKISTKDQAYEVARTKANDYHAKLVEEYNRTMLRNFPEAAKTVGLEPAQTQLFTRGQYLPKIGMSPEFQQTAFALDDSNPISEVVAVDTGLYILHLDAREQANDKEYENKKDEIAAILTEQKRGEKFNSYRAKLRLKANIEDYLNTWEETSSL